MFGLGFTEVLVLALIAFLVFGPKQFPLVVKNFIKLLNELRMAFMDVKTEFYDVQTEAQKQVQQITDSVGKDLEFIKDFQNEESVFSKQNKKNKDEFSNLKDSSKNKKGQ